MTVSTIDLNALNELLDNQKKLDAIFNSAFDDDSFLDSAMSINNQGYSKSSHKNSMRAGHTEADVLVQKSRSAAHIIMPVLLEIAVIYYCIMTFS